MQESANNLLREARQYEAERLWVTIEEMTTEACLLRKEGREASAVRILSEDLPPVLGKWAGVCGLEPAIRKERLRVLIAEKQQQAEHAFLQRRLIVDELMLRLRESGAFGAPSAAAGPEQQRPVRFGLRRRVPISDVSGMIDAVNESISVQERENLLPMRALVQAFAI